MEWRQKLKTAVVERYVAFMTHKSPFVIVLRQLLVPALLAGASVYLVAKFPSETTTIRGLFTEFILALFFLMWFVNIYERAKKRTADDQAFSGLQGDLADLVAELRKFRAGELKTPAAGVGPIPESSNRPVEVHGDVQAGPRGMESATTDDHQLDAISVADSRMTIAKKLATAGYFEAALLQAGVAFEQAVRRYGGEFYVGTSSPKIVSLGALVRNIKSRLPSSWANELETLVKIRNEIAHGNGSFRLVLGDVNYILNNYQEVIDAFESLFRPFRDTGDISFG